jgi:hypothetical protein
VRLRDRLISLIALTAGSVSLILASFFITNPAHLGPYGVTLWFLLMFLAIGGLAALAIYGLKQLIGPTDRPTNRLNTSIRQGALLSSWLTIILALGSLKQLNPRDIFLSLIIIILIETYSNLR